MTPFRHDPFPCDIALERLDAWSFEWPPVEPPDAEFLAAWEHVQDCSACAARLEQRRASDERIAARMRAVPVPLGLQERLLARASSSSSSAAEFDQPVAQINAAGPSATQPAVLRRRAWWLTVATALLVVLSSGVSLWFGWPARGLSLQALYDQTPLNPTGLSEVLDPTARPPLPTNWTRQNGLRTSSSYWFSPRPGATAVAWISFELQVSKQPKIRGVLLAALQSNVIAPPPDWLIAPPKVAYTKRGEIPVAVASWSERGVVYVCFVPGDAVQLERLLRRVAPSAV